MNQKLKDIYWQFVILNPEYKGRPFHEVIDIAQEREKEENDYYWPYLWSKPNMIRDYSYKQIVNEAKQLPKEIMDYVRKRYLAN